MTNVLLIRHATHDLFGKKLLGRTPGVHLNQIGRQQAEQVAIALSVLPIDAIFSGPLERARETAEPLVRRLNLPLQVADEFDELEMGEWTNLTFAELDSLPEWQRWNSQRSETTPPKGESMQQVQARVLGKLVRLCGRFHCVTIFTHADVIRAALTHFLGMDLNLLFRIQIEPGSVSVIQMQADGATVRTLNWLPIGTLI